jgi:hypothetical protein
LYTTPQPKPSHVGAGLARSPPKSREAVEIALPILNQTAGGIISIREAGEGIQHGLLAARIELVDHAAAAIACAVDVGQIAAP